MVTIGVPKELEAGERRVALVPESVGRLKRLGVEVRVERGAGESAGFGDKVYEDAGAVLVDDAAAAFAAEVVCKVRKPTVAEAEMMAPGTTLIALLQPGANEEIVPVLAEREITALALERVPRITRAQSIDVLSSQSTVSGYKAVLLGASEMDKFLPMLTTAAGSIAPAKVFVIGAGVAGLQAIATAKRLGAVVSGFDIRPAAAEQVQSLGATFVASDLISSEAETKGGYAKEQSTDEADRTRAALANHIPGMDMVITTAQIPGKAAPKLITADMVHSMRPGSVIVDLAAETGGNCELTRPGEEVVEHGVTIVGLTNLPSLLATDASRLYARNVQAVLELLAPGGELALDWADEIVTGACVAGKPDNQEATT